MPDKSINPDWTSLDAKALREFLESESGRKVLSLLSDTCPELLDGGDVNRTLVRNGEVKGFNLAVRSLLELVRTQPEPTPESAMYPPLDDEAQWETVKPKPEPTN